MTLLRAVLALLVLAPVAACDGAGSRIPSQFVEGQTVPKPLLDIISSSNVAAQSLQGKMLVLNIWATWCPPCRREMPSLNRLSSLLDPKRFSVVGISIDADTLLVSEFLLKNGIGFSNINDPGGKVMRQLGLQVYPETFVIAPDRTLVRRMSGWHEWSSPDMVASIEALYVAQQQHAGAAISDVPK